MGPIPARDLLGHAGKGQHGLPGKKRIPRSSDRRILKDELIVLKGHNAGQTYPGILRPMTAWVEVEGKERVMVFLTNNTEWAASSVCDLYGCRWAIETFFKELKQTVQLVDFLGHSANAVKWQVWTALLDNPISTEEFRIIGLIPRNHMAGIK